MSEAGLTEEAEVAPSPSPTLSARCKQVAPRRSHPAQSGETFDGPPTLERSGSERRGGAVSSLFPEGERVGVRGGAFLKGKEGRVGFRKKSFLAGETEKKKKAFINKEGRDDLQLKPF